LKGDIYVKVLSFAFNDSLYFSSLPQVQFRGSLEYPEVVRKAAVEGVVKVLLSVDKNGEVTEVMLHKSCGNDSLDEAAFRGMAMAKFFPPVQRSLAGGKIPSLCYIIVEIEFRLLPRKDRPKEDG
jgi:TonB family protein